MVDLFVVQGYIMFLLIFLGLVLFRSWGCGIECNFDFVKYCFICMIKFKERWWM